ncbi:MAG: ribokinase [Planctomycetota bacterium]
MPQPTSPPQPPRVVVVGSTNTDFIVALPRLPGVGETVTDGTFTQTFGGKGANQAVAAARAGAEVTFVACVGHDGFGGQMLDNFQADGICTAHVTRAQGVASGTALVMFDQSGRNYLAVAPGANFKLTAEDVAAGEPAIAAAAAVVLQMEVPNDANRRALEIAKRHGVSVLLNYAPAVGDPLGLTREADVLVVNEVEAAALLGGGAVGPGEASDAAEALRDRGPGWAIVTLGEAGYAAAGPGGASLREDGLTVDAVDTTAAGDTFCGTLAARLAGGEAMDGALRYANVAGALATTVAGAQPSIPRAADIARRLTDAVS